MSAEDDINELIAELEELQISIKRLRKERDEWRRKFEECDRNLTICQSIERR